VHHLRLIELHDVIDKPRSGLAQHHRTRRRNGFHPLRHADLVTDGGVTQSPRTDLPDDHLTRIQADAKLQCDAVESVDLLRQPLGVLLNFQRRQTRADCVVFQRNRRPEHGHDAVAGELVHSAPVAPHDRRGTLDEFRHDLAQPFRTDGRSDVHRVDNVGEQHRHLFELSVDIRRVERGTAGVAELGTCASGFAAARRAHKSGCNHASPPPSVWLSIEPRLPR
jgi:hypothetical protein